MNNKFSVEKEVDTKGLADYVLGRWLSGYLGYPKPSEVVVYSKSQSGMSFNSFLITLVVKEKKGWYYLSKVSLACLAKSDTGWNSLPRGKNIKWELRFPFFCNLDMPKRRRNPNTSKDCGKEGHGNPKTWLLRIGYLDSGYWHQPNGEKRNPRRKMEVLFYM